MALETGTTYVNANTPIAGSSTRRISSVAYATDDMLSELKTASAVGLPSRSCSSRDVASGRPRRTRLTAEPSPRSGCSAPRRLRRLRVRRGVSRPHVVRHIGDVDVGIARQRTLD